MIDVRALNVSISGTRVVDDASFTVRSGGWTAIAGPNGAGKSTILRALIGTAVSSGHIAVDGRDLRAMSRRERSRLLAVAPQIPVIPPGIRVFDYVLLGRTPHLRGLGVESEADLAVARHSVQRLGLDALAGRGLETLSGGERQRAVIARAITQEAPVLLLDEPTSALDLGHQQQVLETIDELRLERALTVVMTMHDLTLAGCFAERLVLIDGGRVVAEGAPPEVLTEPILRRIYRADIRIIHADGGPVVVPHRGATHAHRP